MLESLGRSGEISFPQANLRQLRLRKRSERGPRELYAIPTPNGSPVAQHTPELRQVPAKGAGRVVYLGEQQVHQLPAAGCPLGQGHVARSPHTFRPRGAMGGAASLSTFGGPRRAMNTGDEPPDRAHTCPLYRTV